MLQQGLYRSTTTVLDQDHQRPFDLQPNALQASGDQQANQRHDISPFGMSSPAQPNSVDQGDHQQDIEPLHMPLQALPFPVELERASSSQHWLPAYYWWCQYWQQVLFHSLTAKHVKVEEEEANHGAIVEAPCSTTTDLWEVKDPEEANENTDVLPPPSAKALLPPTDYAGHSPWLPQGWITETQIRRSGSTAGTRDKYYKELKSRPRFRSKTEVFHFLQTGKGRHTKPKCQTICNTSSMICNIYDKGRIVLGAAYLFGNSLLHKKFQNVMRWHIMEAFSAAHLCRNNLNTGWLNKAVNIAFLPTSDAPSVNDNTLHEESLYNADERIEGETARASQEFEGTLVQRFSYDFVEKHQWVSKATAAPCETGLHTASTTMGREAFDAAPLYTHKSYDAQAVPSYNNILHQVISCSAKEPLKVETATAAQLCESTLLQHHFKDAAERPPQVVSAEPCLDTAHNAIEMLVIESNDADPVYMHKSFRVSNNALERPIQEATKQRQHKNLPKQTVKERSAMEGSSSGLYEKGRLKGRPVFQAPRPVILACPAVSFKQLQAMGKKHANMGAALSEQPPEREPLKTKPSEEFTIFNGKGIFGSCKPAQTVPKRPAQGRPSKSPAPKKVKFHSPKKGEQRQASRLWQWLQQPGAGTSSEQRTEYEQAKANTGKALLEEEAPQNQVYRVVQLGGQTQAPHTLSMEMQAAHMAAASWGSMPIYMFPNGCGSQVTQEYLQMGPAFPINSPFGSPIGTQAYWETINKQGTQFHTQFCSGTQSTVQGVQDSQIYTDFINQGNVQNDTGAFSSASHSSTQIQSHGEASAMHIQGTQFNDRFTNRTQGNHQLRKETADLPSKEIRVARTKSKKNTQMDWETASLFQVNGGEKTQALQVKFETRSNLQEADIYTGMFSKGTRAAQSDNQIVIQGGNQGASWSDSQMSWTKGGEIIQPMQFQSQLGKDAQIHIGPVSKEADESKQGQAQCSPQLGRNAYMYSDFASGAQLHDQEAENSSQLGYLSHMYTEYMSKEAHHRESRQVEESGLGREMELHAAQQQNALNLKLAKDTRKKRFSAVLNPELDLSKLDPALSSRQRAKAVQKMKTAHGRDLLATLGRRLCRKLLLESMTWLNRDVSHAT